MPRAPRVSITAHKEFTLEKLAQKMGPSRTGASMRDVQNIMFLLSVALAEARD